VAAFMTERQGAKHGVKRLRHKMSPTALNYFGATPGRRIRAMLECFLFLSKFAALGLNFIFCYPAHGSELLWGKQFPRMFFSGHGRPTIAREPCLASIKFDPFQISKRAKKGGGMVPRGPSAHTKPPWNLVPVKYGDSFADLRVNYMGCMGCAE